MKTDNKFFRKHTEVDVISRGGTIKTISVPKVGEAYTYVDTGAKVITTRVRKPCKNNEGFWHCMDHKESFSNQLQKDVHIREGNHKLAWLCFFHGYEQP